MTIWKKRKFITSFVFSLYILSWVLFGSVKAIKHNLNLLLETDVRQGLEFIDYRNNVTDSTIYLVNKNDFGFFNNFDELEMKKQKVIYIKEDDFKSHIRSESKDGFPLVFQFRSFLFNPFFSKIDYSYWFYGTDMADTGTKFCSWFFFTWIETPFVFNKDVLNLLNFVLMLIVVILIPLLWIIIIYKVWVVQSYKT